MPMRTDNAAPPAVLPEHVRRPRGGPASQNGDTMNKPKSTDIESPAPHVADHHDLIRVQGDAVA